MYITYLYSCILILVSDKCLYIKVDSSLLLLKWQLGHLHHTSSGSLKLLKKRRKRSLSSLLLILGELTSVKHWVTLRLSLPPEEKAAWTSHHSNSIGGKVSSHIKQALCLSAF